MWKVCKQFAKTAILFLQCLSPHPADPTLTTENLMEVVRGVESHWIDLGSQLDMQVSEIQKIHRLYQNDRQKMEAIVKHYVKHNPPHSWKAVSSALERMELPQLAELVTTKYVRGM